MWTDFVAWFQSPVGQVVVPIAAVVVVAILLACVLALLVVRSAVRSLLMQARLGAAAGAVTDAVGAARRSADEAGSDADDRGVLRAASDAELRLRLSGAPGSALAAEWTGLQLKRTREEQDAAGAETIRERLTAWLDRPARAKRLFGADVKRMRDAVPISAPAPAPAPAPGGVTTSEEPLPSAAGSVESPADPPFLVTAERAAAASRLPFQPEPERTETRGPTAAPASDSLAAPAVTAAKEEREPVAALGEQRQPRPLRPVEEPVLAGRPVAVRPVRDVPAGTGSQPERPAAVRAVLEEEPPAERTNPRGVLPKPPSWLDTYDDEAMITKDFQLRTPAPVNAASVRDRTRPGDDLTPRQ